MLPAYTIRTAKAGNIPALRFRRCEMCVLDVLMLAVLGLATCQAAGSVRVLTNIQAAAHGGLYVCNRAPLRPAPLMRLPPGSIRPGGWLLSMLQAQRAGMNGRLEEISPWLKFQTSDWTTPNGAGTTQGWERVPYWLRGYIDLGYSLNDPTVISNATRWIEGVKLSQRSNGYFGPASLYSATTPDLWPAMPMLDALRSYYEYTGDAGALTLMRNYCQWQSTLPDSAFAGGYWPRMRMGDNIESIYWLYNRTGDAWLLELAARMYANMARWDSAGTLPNWHNVNIAEGFRAPTVYWQQSGNASHLAFAEANYQTVMSQYGQVPGGGFGSDENCRTGYRDPRQGFETCGMVEFMRSFEILTRITGSPVWAQRCEDVAFNSFPAALRTNQLSLHYLTAPNQVQLDRFNKSPSVQNGGAMFSYSPFEGYHCCQHNHGQGWPYFCQETWLATWDGGLCASLYAATTVRATVGDGSSIEITEQTDYPFGDIIELEIGTTNSVSFPLYLRVPQWCSGAWAEVNGSLVVSNPVPGSYIRIERSWTNEDNVKLRLPRRISTRVWTANKNSVTVDYGALSFALEIPELWRSYGSNPSWPEWEAYPRSPWNYGLSVNLANPESSFTVVADQGLLPAYPFSLETTPIRLVGKGRLIPEWTSDSLGCASPLQQTPAYTTQPEQTITLIPMGAARLRISAFPTVTTNKAANAWVPGFGPAASHCYSGDSVQAICDGLVPASSSDTSIPRMTWWDHVGTAEWLRAEFGAPHRIGEVSIYWYDDTGFGQCRVPQSWTLEYLNGTNWENVPGAGGFGVARDAWNTVSFTPVETTALRLRVQLRSGFSAGVLEWRIPREPVTDIGSRYPLDGNIQDVLSGRHGSQSGGSFVPDRFGSPNGALLLDGVTQYATIPRQVQLNWTIGCWARTTAVGGTGQWWAGKGLVDGEVGGITDDFGIALVGGKAGFGVGNPDITITSSVSINDGLWHHVAAVRDSLTGLMQLYVDGQLEVATMGPTSAKAAPSSLRLGSLQTGVANGYLSGALDEVRVYDRVLQPREIAALAGIAPLDPPEGLTASEDSGRVHLSWQSSPTATAYNVKWATNSGGPYAIVAGPVAANAIEIAILHGIPYFFVVSSVNGSNESANSLEVSAPLQFTSWSHDGSSLLLSGWGGAENETYQIMTSTDLTTWTSVATNTFGLSGSFSNAILPASSRQFFRIQRNAP